MDIEAILEMYEDYTPSSTVPGPRNMFNQRPGFMKGELVKQGPNAGKWKVADLYPRGTKGGSTIYFDKEDEALQAIKDRKAETGRQQTTEELTKKYKSLLKEEGYKSWADAPKEIKKKLKNKMASKYVKVGPSTIKEKTIKLLEEKKPINPKTGLPYTQEEYIKLSRGQKGNLSARLRDKKQKAVYKKRQGYYPEKEGNRLINYMKKAAEQQSKLPVSDRTYVNVFESKGRFVGVKDIKNNKLYTHIDYDLSKEGAQKGTVVTKHPGHEELDVFFKAAKKFKYQSPDKLLGSYFSRYERVPTYNEIYNFFTVDRNAPIKAFTSNNGLTIHHQDVIAKNPTSNFQLLTTKKNTEANTIINRLKRGEISETRANYDLKKIGATQEGYGISKEKITPGKGLGVAKREAVKLFKDAYKVNPNVVEDITQKLGILGCPKGLQAASGGRIKFSKGTTCAIKGREVLEKGLKNGFPKNQQGDLARKILGSGKFLKEAVSLRGLFGPAALAFTVAAEAGIVGYDMLATGKSFKEAIGSSLFNYALGDKTKIDSDEEFMKRLKNIKVGPQGYQRMGDAEIGKMLNFKANLDDMKRGFDLYGKLDAITKNRKQIGSNPEDAFNENAFQLDSDKQEDAVRADIRDYNKTGTPRRVTDYLLSDKAKEGADATAYANLLVKEDQLKNAGTGDVLPKVDQGIARNLKQTKYDIDNLFNPKKLDEFGQMFMNATPGEQSYFMGRTDFMEGGIASLNVNKK